MLRNFIAYLLSVVPLALLLSSCDANSFPEDPLSIMPSEINEDITLLQRLSPYYMSGYTVVKPGVSLVIEPGTEIIVEHEGCTEGEIGSCSALIVSKGAFLVAEGEADQPIRFTTENERIGDWSGIVINGDAPCNTGVDSEPPTLTGAYCGANPADSSGVLKYVIVEYAGAVVVESAQHYPSSIAFHGVGNRTVVEHVYARESEYNGFTFVGGTVDLRYALSTCIAENSFAWHDGWQGRGQFWISQQCESRADSGVYGANISEADSTSILDVVPRSNPVVYNFTLLGPPNNDTGREGIELTLGTGAKLVNGIVINHRQKGFWINDKESCEFIQDGSISLRNTYFFNNDRDFTDRCGENALFLNDVEGNVIGTASILVDPFNTENPNFMLSSEGLAIPADPAAGALDWFEPADYIGGMGNEDWTIDFRGVGETENL